MKLDNTIHRFVARTVYPLFILAGVSSYLLLLTHFPGEIWIAYVPVVLAGLGIIAMEVIMPLHVHWKPGWQDLRTDMTYMLLVQGILPIIVGMLVVHLLHGVFSAHAVKFLSPWPRNWPLLLQGGLMLVLADLFSYWLHRLAHTLPMLWRLHAVHHSSDKLYWLNVGRFHPMEKFLQFVCSSLPFLVLGVNKEVLDLYFVFYAINGFFQHSNIKLEFGWLNYVISTAELHRWHHSPRRRISNHNYGNNLVIWDLLFGTWFLPRKHALREVGSGMMNYPKGFFRQWRKPFEDMWPVLTRWLLQCLYCLKRTLFRVVMNYFTLRHWRGFLSLAKRPEQNQASTLRRILAKQAGTQYGKKYTFDTIRNVEDFKRTLPIVCYDNIAGMIKQQELSGQKILCDGDILFYARTSGTTGAPKDIPITAQTIRQYKYQQKLLACYQYSLCPEAFEGMALGVVSPALEGHLDSHTAYGSVSGYIYANMPKLIRDRYVVPAEVLGISDYDLKYRIILRLALAQTNITYLGTANPSTLLRLREILNADWEMLLESLRSGVLAGINSLSPSLQHLLAARIKPEPERYDQLVGLCGEESIEFKTIWPGIRMVTTWTSGYCQFALKQLTTSLPADARIIELGYVASELRGTMTCDPVTNGGIPLLDQVFYEFIEKADWEAGHRETLSISQIKSGQLYFVIVTTCSGLYRYFMNDLVMVVGFRENTPLLKFVQKGRGVTNITGEKIYESQVIEALTGISDQFRTSLRFYLALANPEQARYEFYLQLESAAATADVLAREIDTRLAEMNVEYREKRSSGRLALPRVHFLRQETAEAYKRHQLAAGQREAQYKMISLMYRDELVFPLSEYVIQDERGQA